MRKLGIYFLITILIFSQNPLPIMASPIKEEEGDAEKEIVLFSEQINEYIEGYIHTESIEEDDPEHLIPDETQASLLNIESDIEVDDIKYSLIRYVAENEPELIEVYVDSETIVPIELAEEFKESRFNQNEGELESVPESEDEEADDDQDVHTSNLEEGRFLSQDSRKKEQAEIDEKDSIQSVAKVEESKTSRLARIKNSSVRIYESIGGQSSNAGSKYTDYVYYVKRQAKHEGNTYYLLSTEPSASRGTIGWVKTTDVNSYSHNSVDKNRRTFYIKGNGTARSKAWGATKDVVHSDLSKYKDHKFHVNLTETVGNNTWYRGRIDGKGPNVWLHSNFVNQLEKGKISRLARINTSNVKVYESVGGKSTNAGSKYTDYVYYVKREAKLGNSTYYLLSTEPSASRGTIGWVKSTDVSSYSHKSVNKESKTYHILGNGNARSKAWGAKKDIVHRSLANLTGESFHVNLTEKVGNNTWYRGKINGKGQNLWLHSNFLNEEVEESKTSRLARLNNSSVKIFESIGGKSSNAGSKHIDYVYYVKREATYDGNTYYLLSSQPSASRGTIGWVNSKDITSYSHKSVDKKSKTFYIKGNGTARSKAWGGKKDVVHSSLTKFTDHAFYVNLTEKVGNNTWYRGKIQGEGKNIWLHSNFLNDEIKESTTSRLARIKSSSVEIYQSIGEKSTKAGSRYIDYVYYVKRQAKLGSNTYYLLSEEPSASSGTIGWVNSKDVTSYSHKNVDKSSNTFYIKGNGSARSKAWGAKKDVVHSSLRKYAGDFFQVNLTEKVGNNTWYRGKINGNGRTVWLHSNFVTQTYVETTSYNITFNNAVTLQYNRRDDDGNRLHKTDINGYWRIAKKSEVEYYLNPNNFKNDARQKFQFLNLSKPTSVSASNLNKLLVGKGTLHKQGTAFYNAARYHSLNEVYLIAHAQLETGHGTSTLATGVEVGLDKNGKPKLVTKKNRNKLTKIKTTYNMFGIGAVDSDPIGGGAKTAYKYEWFTPKAAIEGGAKWIADDYISNQHNQNTLYKMKWNPNMYNGYAWKQYATDVGWASKQANIIYDMYETVGFPNSMSFDYPTY